MSEEMTRALDEQFDTHIEVALNPYGAWQAIQSLSSRLEKAREVIKPFAEQSRLFDTASAAFGMEPRPDDYKPRTEFNHGQLRAARAWMEQNDE